MRNLSKTILIRIKTRTRTRNGQELKTCSMLKMIIRMISKMKRNPRSCQRWQSKSPKSSSILLALIPKKRKLKHATKNRIINCFWSGRFLQINNQLIKVNNNPKVAKSMKHCLNVCFHCKCAKLSNSQTWTKMGLKQLI